MFEVMDDEGEDVNHKAIERYKGDISFENVSFAYEEDEYVLKNISFNVKLERQLLLSVIRVLGKVRLMNLLFRFYDPQKGEITIDGQSNSREWSRQQVRSHMGIVLQDPFLFSGTILPNVTMNDKRISRRQSNQCIKSSRCRSIY